MSKKKHINNISNMEAAKTAYVTEPNETVENVENIEDPNDCAVDGCPLEMSEPEATIDNSTAEVASSYDVKVDIHMLNIRRGPGMNYNKTGDFTGRGIFTIVETRDGEGSKAGWGRLSSGAGWICLDYTERV